MLYQLHRLYSTKIMFVFQAYPPIVSFFFPCLVYVKILSVTQTMQYQKLDGNELQRVRMEVPIT